MIKIINFYKLIRFNNLIIGMTTIMTSAYLLDYYNWINILIGMLQVASIMGLANMMNDIIDIETDKLNKPNRTLVRKLISLDTIKKMMLFFLILIILLSFYGTLLSNVFLYCIIIPVLIFYNVFLKQLPLIGNISIAFLLSAVFIYSEILFINSFNKLLIPATLAFHLSFIREVIKDLHDYKGDLQSNMKTLPIIFGIVPTCKFISIYIIMSLIYFIFPYVCGIYSMKYLVLLIFFVEIPLVYSLFLLLYFPTITTFKHLSMVYKLLTITGLVVILSTKSI